MPSTEEALAFMYEAVVHQRIDLTGPWRGWRIAGRDLVAPDGQRISPARMAGIMWRDELGLRLKGYASRRKAEADSKKNQLVKVVVIPLSQYLDGQKLRSA